ncbi:MAG TPA: DUF1549 domain-containing protein, partial [Longimicrobiales bacterium]|nr:DUF1549 domain-containing protein [Longimicrobiales bacterium]
MKDAEWPRGRIDRYILAALEAKACAPAPDADKSVLERRVTFDLTGLPPVPGEEDDLATDGSPDAFTRLVDRLLASPRFGERWGRHWLDVARYGESVGLRGLIFTEAWRFRDYVIDAFNRDVPFTDFVEEQIAGDLLPHASLEERRRRLTATGFLALGNTNLEEQDKKLLDMDVVDEQLDTIGKAFLGQTIGCARCHDHKFDPISTREYYAMAGILRSTRTLIHANVSSWIDAPLPLESGAERPYAEHEAAVAALEAVVKAARMVAATIVAARDLPGIVIDCAQARAVGEWKHSQQLKRYVGDGYLHDLDAGKGEKTLTFLLELPRAGRYEVRLAYIHGPDRAARVPVTVFHAGGETTVHVDQRESPPIDGHFASLGQFRFEQNGFAHILVSNEGTKGYVTADAVQLLPAEGLARATGTAPEPRAAAADLKTLEEKLKSLREGGPRRPMYMTVKEGERIEDAPIHVRGSVHDLGPPVPRGFLSTLTRGPEPRIPAEESGRRELARWIVSHASHVTARVFVNRAWHWLMGAGIVRTTDNFGTMGELPSHPELLDDLALRFVEDGWSVKRLVREIVLSRTYALGTEPMDAGLASDPENRLRWRAQRRRLEAECIRDAVLSASGELRLEMGGR